MKIKEMMKQKGVPSYAQWPQLDKDTEMSEKINTCPKCNEPYYMYDMFVGDQSMCPSCIGKLRARILKNQNCEHCHCSPGYLNQFGVAHNKCCKCGDSRAVNGYTITNKGTP